METTSWKDMKAQRQPRPERVAELVQQMEAEERAYSLRQIRESLGVTQSEVAQRMNLTQPTISALEKGELGRSGLDTLRAYVTALGGAVEVVATFGNQKLILG
ncbi:putative transcriptional regulator [Arcanobacterium wilhelmae]|uniref:Transcriptional regulator n=1 Tax=Arcanobacterium wilhelmae TaxID=1803177 RepID=A0ABT9NC59_9ACTO|nr:XRE family transcriptional regulator [Arcanobacterium wilhelmae]MDP9800971.1 putative transcriptional regulator [Arcanobacterium wilhelmae]WFN90331.1 XRE family transcriptional regulator [Arcanobacterium wilhelmae]